MNIKIITLKEYELIVGKEIDKVEGMTDKKKKSLLKLLSKTITHGMLFERGILTYKDVVGENFET